MKEKEIFDNFLAEIDFNEANQEMINANKAKFSNKERKDMMEKDLFDALCPVEDRIVTNIIPSNSPHRFIKRVINKVIRPYSKQQVDYNIAAANFDRALLDKIYDLEQQLALYEEQINSLEQKLDRKKGKEQ